MRKITILIFFAALLLGCKQKGTVSPSFYYWKTVYQNDPTETAYLRHFAAKSLYLRIMDVDISPVNEQPAPVSPVSFKTPFPQEVNVIPVVYIVNQVFNNLDDMGIETLAVRIANFTAAKVKQGGKPDYAEIQIDCDWTRSTRDTYFKFLKSLKANPLLKDKILSVTLRLHQVKNLSGSGIPPADKVLLMCYNMGNLRQFGTQNSILDMKQMELYLKDVLEHYPLKLDLALPLFNWSVVFRHQQYAGIARHIGPRQLNDPLLFKQRGTSILYDLLQDYPAAGLQKGDVIRYEQISLPQLLDASDFLSRYLKADNRNLVFYHLDKPLLKDFTYDDLQKAIDRF